MFMSGEAIAIVRAHVVHSFTLSPSQFRLCLHDFHLFFNYLFMFLKSEYLSTLRFQL